MPVLVLMLAVLLAPLSARAQSPRLDSALERIAQERELRGDAPALRLARASGLRTRGDDRIAVMIVAEGPASALDRRRLARLGAEATGEAGRLLRVWVPVRNLRALAQQPGVRFVRPPLRPIPLGLGPVVSEGVALSGADLLQGEWVTGEGVKVAVVDVGFASFSLAQTNGELPAGAFQVNMTGQPFQATTNHGTTVSEVLMDMAPGAELHAIRIDDEVDLQEAADYIHANGIRVVNMSIAFLNASYYDDTGVINDIINDSHDNHDVFWAIAAGNFALRHWNGTYVDNDGDRRIEFDGVADERMVIGGTSGQECIFLNWDEYGAPEMNLDLNVYKASGASKASSSNRQPPFDPAETVCFTYVAAETPYEIEVRRKNGSDITASRITIFSANHNLEFSLRLRSESLTDPADAHGAFSVAAIAAADWELPAPSTEAYSSRGPTTDGRIKPDIAAMDKVATWSRGTNTVGTSFAAPHVAGAAALLLAQAPALTALQIFNELQAIAVDQGDPGLDPIFGAGQMVADENLGGLLDTDLDGVGNQADNCRYEPNTLQLDSGSIGGAGPDGVGDACQCGDVDDDGSVLQSDADALRDFFAGLGNLAAPPKCNVTGAADGGIGDCDQVDFVVMRRALAIQPPMIGQVCAPALP